MPEDLQSLIQILKPNSNYWASTILVMIGLYGMIGKRNLMKKLIGLVIFQTAIILFYVSMGVKEDSTIPILRHDLTHGAHGEAPPVPGEYIVSNKINPDEYSNPLPHVLMLTAIVVGVATLGVALATVQKVYLGFGTLEEDEIIEQLKDESDQQTIN